MALINGVKLNYVRIDDGPDDTREHLVMVHGLATNMAFWYFQYAPAVGQALPPHLVRPARSRAHRTCRPDGYSPRCWPRTCRPARPPRYPLGAFPGAQLRRCRHAELRLRITRSACAAWCWPTATSRPCVTSRRRASGSTASASNPSSTAMDSTSTPVIPTSATSC